jgi:hypothetical protein
LIYSGKPKTNVFPKYSSPRKAPQYEPPTANRVLPNTTTTPGKKQGPKQVRMGDRVLQENNFASRPQKTEIYVRKLK